MSIRFEKGAIEVKSELEILEELGRKCTWEDTQRIRHYKEALNWLFNSKQKHLIGLEGEIQCQ